MPIREYKCSECGLLDERILGGEPPATMVCRRCGAPADLKRMPSSIALARSQMGNAPIDNRIGRDAEAKWVGIHEQQARRNAVRAETKVQGITSSGHAPGVVNFKPISAEQRAARTELTASIQARGYGETEKLPGD